MRRQVSIIVVAVFLCLSGKGWGQKYNFSFEHIGMEDGLPARMVYHIAQDGDGFLWVSTQLGIHRFDGRYFKTYSNVSLGLPSRSPGLLVFDGDHGLWISCPIPNEGRSRTIILDTKTYRFLSVEEATNGLVEAQDVMTIAAPHRSEKGVLYVQPDGTLMHYDGALRSYGRFNAGKGGTLRGGAQRRLLVLGAGALCPADQPGETLSLHFFCPLLFPAPPVQILSEC